LTLETPAVEVDADKWARLPDERALRRTVESLNDRGINAQLVSTKEEALKLVVNMIPDNSEIASGASASLDEIGLLQLLKSGNHHWRNLKDQIMNEKDPVKRRELQVKATAADYYLGSVHAVAETGEIVVVSASGSQIPAYAFNAKNVIWVVGAQKIVPNLEQAMKRIREYSLPLENARMRKFGYPGSMIGKMLIFERERGSNRKLTMILVKEQLGA
jgi:L-lactate utilization protein LutB